MKNLALTFALFAFAATASFAQSKKATPAAPAAKTTETVTATPAATLTAESMVFKNDVHDFGNIAEGPAAEYEFTFTNTGKEPIVIERCQASCGCTTPSYSKEPVLPGKTGSVKASYATQGRPNAFTKTITVFSNVGTKVITIKGNVEKKPETSVPENNSMIKTN